MNQPVRSHALDALRGFAILTMVLSGVVPYGVLPAWMYHAQIPPPNHAFDPNLPGLTWVDLVFPMFLFALGAAIPLALSRRIESGMPGWKLLPGILQRGFLLGFFAIFLRHVRPHVLNPKPEPIHWLIAILGFVLMFPIFARLPAAWPNRKKCAIRFAGWACAVVMLLLLRYPDGSGFSLYRSDIIIIVLTNAAVFGPLIWLTTKNNLLLRLGVLAVLLAFRLAGAEEGWVQWLWNFSPLPWIYKLYYLQYLFIVIPGTIVGDLLLKKKSEDLITIEIGRTKASWASIILLLLCVEIILLIGLQSRWLWQTTALSILLLITIAWLLRVPKSAFEKMIRLFFNWGTFWLILGLVFEPFEGGIKKDHPTLSYYFVTTGMSIFLMIAFSIIIEVFKKRRWLQLLTHNGKNPVIAYVGFANLIWPVLALTGLERLILAITPTPWLGFFRAVFYTVLLALIVSIFSKKKMFWRT